MVVGNIVNPPSLRGSSDITNIYQTTSDVTAKVAEYINPLQIKTYYLGQLLGLSGDSIVQSSEEYSDNADYTVTFTPTAIVRKTDLSIVVSYPTTVAPTELALRTGC